MSRNSFSRYLLVKVCLVTNLKKKFVLAEEIGWYMLKRAKNSIQCQGWWYIWKHGAVQSPTSQSRQKYLVRLNFPPTEHTLYLRSILLPVSVVGRNLGKCLSICLATTGSLEGLPRLLLEEKSPINSLTRLMRKLFKLRCLWWGDSWSRIKLLKIALSRRSNKILSHHFFPDTGMG